MAPLVNYASDDDDSDDSSQQARPTSPTRQLQSLGDLSECHELYAPRQVAKPSSTDILHDRSEQQSPERRRAAADQPGNQSDIPARPAQAPGPDAPLGPALGPSRDDRPAAANPLPEPDSPAASDSLPPFALPVGEDTTVRDLTLPPVPNLDVPGSPPGSPAPGLTDKFEHFLELRAKGQRFNDKLAASEAMRNPDLTEKLLDYVGLQGEDEEEVGGEGENAQADDAVDKAKAKGKGPAGRVNGWLVEQYSSTLPLDVWDPRAFPPEAFMGPLRASQERIAKDREAARAAGTREKVVFVPAGARKGLVASGAGGGAAAKDMPQTGKR